MKKIILVLCLSTVGCLHAPPTLSPKAQVQFNDTRVQKALDLIRDTAIDANAQTPPLLSVNATRIVVTFHKSASQTINASQNGWRTAVLQQLDDLQKNVGLLKADVDRLAPYIALARALINSLPLTSAQIDLLTLPPNWLFKIERPTQTVVLMDKFYIVEGGV